MGRRAHLPGYRLKSVRTRQEATVEPVRNAPFAHVHARADEMLAASQPAISVHKTYLMRNLANVGRKRQPGGKTPAVRVHDFPSDAERRTAPFPIYDMARNEASASARHDHHPPAFAASSIH